MIKKLKTDIFFRQYLVYFTGSMVVAFLNYIFHPILGRLLTPADFGDVQALISLIAQTAIIFGVFSIMTVNVTTNVEDQNKRDAIISQFQRIIFWFIGIIFFFLIFLAPGLKSFFNFSTVYPVIGLAVLLPISAMTIFRTAFLQGRGCFFELSLSGVILSLGRLLFSLGLVLLGLNVLGVTLGLIVANIFMLIYLYYQTRKSLHIKVKINKIYLETSVLVKELSYGLLVLFGTGLVVVFYTSDVLIVKHYLNSADAGLYSGISAVAKILFFALGPTSAILLSSVKIKNSFIENLPFLKKSLAISLIIGSLGLLTFYLFNDIIVRLLMGNRYSSFAYLLPKAGLVMFFTAITEIFIFYFLALRRFFLIAVSVLGVIFLGLTIFSGYTNIEAILNNLIISLAVIIAILISVYAKDYFNNNTSL